MANSYTQIGNGNLVFPENDNFLGGIVQSITKSEDPKVVETLGGCGELVNITYHDAGYSLSFDLTITTNTPQNLLTVGTVVSWDFDNTGEVYYWISSVSETKTGGEVNKVSITLMTKENMQADLIANPAAVDSDGVLIV